MSKSAIDIYNELMFEEPVICAVLAATAMRVTLDQYQEAGEKEEVTDFMERFMQNLDEIGDEVLP